MKISTGIEYEVDFDGDSITEQQAKQIPDILNKCSYVVHAKTHERMLVGFYDSKLEEKIIFGFYINDNGLQASCDDDFGDWAKILVCKQCDGNGKYVVGSHVETGKYACWRCSGTGIMYLDFISGVQQRRCPQCIGTGWLEGEHTVNDYEICQECNGLGLLVK